LREVLSEPAFPKKECETAKIQSVQELKHLDDEPLSKAFVHLKELYFGEKWGHNELGHEREIPSITRDDIQSFWSGHYVPKGALFAASSGSSRANEAPPAPPPANVSRHIQKDSEQTQIVLAYPSVARSHPQFFAAQLGVSVLSGGMSARLFTEVRERRALVYSVGAQSSSLRATGVCYAYAGTTAKRAQETLTVLKAELMRLPKDVTEEEVERARIGVKAHLLMDQESTGTRVRELLDDLYFQNRILSMEELIAQIDGVTVKDVKTFWTAYPIEPYALVTIGKEMLK
jgi:predicted Zn-dependent peptidase